MVKEDEIESSFDLTNLLDPSYPLLKMLKDSCPGTFKHSQSVAAMVESICTAIGIDPLKSRIASMYHDIGKARNPKLFTENQLADEKDPHEELDPHISAQLIIKHVSDSVIILINDPNIPRDIIQMISQHHGNSITRFFFDKSKGANDKSFRYNLPIPNTAEAAILMICDIVEATSRSNFQSGKLQIEELVEKIFNELMTDHQLDEVTLKWGLQNVIKETLIVELQGIFQKRVDYDKAKK